MTSESLKGKFALVSGSASRIGRAFALSLAEHGCHVALHYHTQKDAAERTASDIRALGVNTELLCADLRDPAAPGRIASEVLRSFPSLDILINNASSWSTPESIHSHHSILEETLEEWETNLAVNCRAPFFLMQAFAPSLKKSRGLVVNILDESAESPFLNRSSHSISKSGLLAASRIAARTLTPEVRVHALEFGDILPPDALPESQRSRRIWLGLDSAVQALHFVISQSDLKAELLSASEILHMGNKV